MAIVFGGNQYISKEDVEKYSFPEEKKDILFQKLGDVGLELEDDDFLFTHRFSIGAKNPKPDHPRNSDGSPYPLAWVNVETNTVWPVNIGANWSKEYHDSIREILGSL